MRHMQARFADSHVHLDADAFADDRAAVLARARHAGVDTLVIPAVDAAGWPTLRTLCATTPGIHAAYGLHPMFLTRHRERDLDDLRRWLRRERAVAVGECGLDFFVDGLDPVRQRHYFRGQLEIARECDLPVIVHARRAVEEVIHTVRAVGRLRGVVHSFSGSAEQARQLHQLGFLIGLGGPVTYPRARRLRRLAAELPLAQLLLETDAPDQPDSDHYGQRNEPGYLPRVAAEIATLRGIDIATLAAATHANARRLFALDD